MHEKRLFPSRRCGRGQQMGGEAKVHPFDYPYHETCYDNLLLVSGIRFFCVLTSDIHRRNAATIGIHADRSLANIFHRLFPKSNVDWRPLPICWKCTTSTATNPIRTMPSRNICWRRKQPTRVKCQSKRIIWELFVFTFINICCYLMFSLIEACYGALDPNTFSKEEFIDSVLIGKMVDLSCQQYFK